MKKIILFVTTITILIICSSRFLFGYGNLQFKDDHNNTVNSLWDERSYNSATFPNGITWLLNNQGTNGAIPITIGELQTIVNDAFETWEALPESKIAFNYDGLTTNGTPGTGGHNLPPDPGGLDGDNLIVFGDTPSGALGITYIFTLTDTFTFDDHDADPNNDTDFGGTDSNPDIPEGTYSSGTILDVDIMLDKDYTNWSVTGERDKIDLQAVLVHEIGHFIGLCHSCIRETFESQATMFPFIASNPEGLEQESLSQDDIAGVGFYYPSSSFSTNFGSISGSVSKSSIPQCGTHIWTVKSDDRSTIIGVYSDDSGNYVINGLPPGNYILRIEPLCVDDLRINEIVSAQTDDMLMNFMAEIYNDVASENSATIVNVIAGSDSSGHNFTLSNPTNDLFEDDGSIAQARLLLTDGIRELHHIYPDGDKDYFKFNAIANHVYKVSTENIIIESYYNDDTGTGYNSDTSFWIYDTDSELLIRKNADQNYPKGIYESSLLFIPELDGIYYLMIEHDPIPLRGGYNPLPGCCSNYDIFIEEITPATYYVDVTNGSNPSLMTSNAEPFTLINGDTLFISVDGNSEQTVTFSATDNTAEEIVTAINTQTAGIKSLQINISGNKYVKIISERGGLLTSPKASIQVTGGTANIALGFPTSISISGDGTQLSPWASIQYAIDSVSGSYTNHIFIKVTEGTYYENIICNDYESISGGYESISWNRNIDANQTILNGMSLESVVVAANQIIIDGLKITNGSGHKVEQITGDYYYGGGVYIGGKSPTLTNCKITDNHVSHSDGEDCTGGGIYIAGPIAQPNIIDCIISENSVSLGDLNVKGGGIYSYQAAPLVVNNVIVNNVAEESGAGIWSSDYYPGYYNGQYLNNAIVQNRSTGGTSFSGGGGVFALIIKGVFKGNIVVSNSAYIAGGIYIWYYTYLPETIEQNIIVGNQATNDGGGVIFIPGDFDNTFVSNVIIGNISGQNGGGIFWSCYAGGRCLNNTVIHNSASGLGGGIYMLDSGSEFKNNIIARNQGIGIYEGDSSSDSTVQNNNIFGNSIAGYYDDDTASSYTTANDINTLVLGGTVEDNVDWNPIFKTAPGGTVENITYNASTYQSSLTENEASFIPNALARLTINPNTSQYLHFYIIANTTNTIITWGDMTSVATPPCTYQVFDYHLAEGSQNIDAGMDVSAYVTTDIDGDTRPLDDGFDIGADEYKSSTGVNNWILY